MIKRIKSWFRPQTQTIHICATCGTQTRWASQQRCNNAEACRWITVKVPINRED